MSLICIPIQARSEKELRKKIIEASPNADLLEIWIDHLEGSIDPKKIITLTAKPLIIVNKSKNEGGRWQGSQLQKIATLIKYLQAGVAYLDLNLASEPKLLKKLLTSRAAKKNTRIILSYHNFKQTPSAKKLLRLAQRGFQLGADIVKIVTTAQSFADNLTILELLAMAQRQKKRLIAFCMGPHGKISRLLAAHFNSYIIYLAANAKSRTATGQLTVEEFKKYKLL